MAKTKNKSVAVENPTDKEQAEVAVPNHANLRFNNKDEAEQVSKKANDNVAEVRINTQRMVFNPQNLRS